MKKLKVNKEKIISMRHGNHSFLFWLVLPIILVWLSVGYITGFVADKPLWLIGDRAISAEEEVVPYFKEHATFAEDLDQPFVTFWFDDAWLSQYEKAYPVLKKNGFPGTIAVPVNSIETKNYMNWAQLRVVQKNGWETTDHSLAHDCQMEKWDREKIRHELTTSRLIMWKNELAADIFVTPCGVDSKVLREEAQKLFVSYRTVDPGYNNPSDFNLFNLQVRNIDDKTTLSEMKSWIDYAKKNKVWVILVFHKVGEVTKTPEGDEFNITDQNFKNIVDYVKDSGIKVVVPSQIIASQSL